MNGTHPASAKLSPRLCAAVFLLVMLGTGGCSSVGSINDRAVLAQSDSDPVPAGPAIPWTPNVRTEYRIGPRDLLEIDIYELEEPNETKQLKARVSQSGSIVLPLIGAVKASGRTVEELQQQLVKLLAKDFLVDPSAQVVVAEYQARSITVLGAVKKPGTIRLQANSTTLIDALAYAGGATDEAGSMVYVVRSGLGMLSGGGSTGPRVGTAAEAAASPEESTVIGPRSMMRRVQKIDLIDLVEHGNLEINTALDDGDVVHVPPVSHFFVSGLVTKGGSFPLRGEITILKAIAIAGGLKDRASPDATVLIRKTETGREHIPINLHEVEAGTDSDVLLRADDVIIANETGGDRALRNIGEMFRGLLNIGYSVN